MLRSFALLALLPVALAAQVRNPVSAPRPDTARAAVAGRPTGTIDGVVSDTGLRPLAVAEAAIVGTNTRVTTTADGRFRLVNVPAGQYLLIVRRIGYAPTSSVIQVVPGDTVRLAYTLNRSDLLLDTVRVRERRVTLRMLDFERRRAQGLGQFLTQEQIDRRNVPNASDLLRPLRGVYVSPLNSDNALGELIALSRREGGTFGGDGAGACAMQVVLDGVIMPRFFPLNLLPPPRDIAGVEVYDGPATSPPQFGGPDRRCGTILVWTRDGYY
jgi:hypothetical protein